MRERLYKMLALLFGGWDRWATAKYEGLLHERMMRVYPKGTKIRLTCDCDDPKDDHDGFWYVFDYHPDAGDFRIMREIPPEGTPIFVEMYEYARPAYMARA